MRSQHLGASWQSHWVAGSRKKKKQAVFTKLAFRDVCPAADRVQRDKREPTAITLWDQCQWQLALGFSWSGQLPWQWAS